jgi:ubiquinone/menaquinone biosynthesis C-methylase UbiE
MDRLEDGMWWYDGLHAHLLFFLRQALVDTQYPLVLDAGCGSGGLLRILRHVMPPFCVLGLDEGACASARMKSRCPVCVGSVNAMPFSDNTLPLSSVLMSFTIVM